MLTNYREILVQEFAMRVKANPSYSMRAFARDLDLKPAFLSHVLKGLRGISEEKARGIAKKMRFSASETTYFCNLVTMSTGRSQILRERARQYVEAHRSSNLKVVSTDQFSMMADWYHMAIRELVKIPDFVAEPQWISQRLGITVSEAKGAWERLQRMGLVFQNSKGDWESDEFVTTPDCVPSKAIQQFHTQIIEKAKKSIEEDPLSERSHTSISFGIHHEQIEEAREIIREFRRDLERRLIASRRLKKQSANRLYCFSLQFFGLDKTK